MYTYKVIVNRVIDGDTLDIDVDLGFDIWLRGIRIRLNRINAYETKLGINTNIKDKEKGLEAKEYLKTLLENKQVTITTVDTKEKFGRWLGEIYINDMNINDDLVTKGFAIYQKY